jgi:3-isopropylmalate dehydrogenase
MILSAAMMLDWLGGRAGEARLAEAAGLIEAAMERGFASRRVRPREFGGPHGTAEIGRAVAELVAEGSE